MSDLPPDETPDETPEEPTTEEILGSILNTIKKMLGIESSNTSFDVDIIIGINSAIMSLNQLGVGPVEGFSISDASAVWSDLLGEVVNIESVKTYIYLKTKLVFDPPSNSSVIEAYNNQINEIEYRIIVQIESTSSQV